MVHYLLVCLSLSQFLLFMNSSHITEIVVHESTISIFPSLLKNILLGKVERQCQYRDQT